MGLLAVIGPSRNDQRRADRSLRRRYLVRMSCACHQARISRSMAGKSTLEETGLNVGMAIALYSSFASIAFMTRRRQTPRASKKSNARPCLGRAHPPAVPPTCRIRRRPFASPHAALDRNGTQTSDSVLPVTGETPAEPTEVNGE